MSHQALLKGQREATLERVKHLGRVLVIQDTCEFSYAQHPETRGLGPGAGRGSLGFLAHTSLVVNETGGPEGLLSQQVWARKAEAAGQRHRRHERAFSEKESYKWVRGLPEQAWAKQLPEQVVVVCDAEAHIFALLAMTTEREMAFIVRAARKRSVTVEGEDLHEFVARQPVQSRSALSLQRRPDRDAREALVEMRFVPVTLQRPRRTQTEAETLTVTAVEVVEPAPPDGEKGVHWLLLTSLPVTTVAEAQEVARWYSYRWLVERFHYTLKSGCRMEESQLRDVERLERLLAVNNLVAWRLLWLTYQARLTPEAPCTVALSDLEWQALWVKQQRHKPLPASPPTLHQAVAWIAQMGGHLGRKGDGPPGVAVLWRGWKRLADMVEIWSLTRPPSSQKDVGNA